MPNEDANEFIVELHDCIYPYTLTWHFLIADNKGGIRKSELVAWYLDQIQEQLDSEEELLERKGFIEKVIERLTYHVRIEVLVCRANRTR